MEYIMLDICEKYSLNPITEFDPLPDEIKFKMIAKWHLDRESKSRQPSII
ncbi:hypothetical protein [Microcystis phage MaeS]|nr:hypothetical protein [Microcystis phage MaeS]